MGLGLALLGLVLGSVGVRFGSVVWLGMGLVLGLVSVRISLLRLTCEHTTTDIQQISALRILPTILQHFSAFYQQHRYALSTKAADKQYLSNTLFQNTLSSENVLAHIREFHCNAE